MAKHIFVYYHFKLKIRVLFKDLQLYVGNDIVSIKKIIKSIFIFPMLNDYPNFENMLLSIALAKTFDFSPNYTEKLQ